jgi:hypothetical protein
MKRVGCNMKHDKVVDQIIALLTRKTNTVATFIQSPTKAISSAFSFLQMSEARV